MMGDRQNTNENTKPRVSEKYILTFISGREINRHFSTRHRSKSDRASLDYSENILFFFKFKSITEYLVIFVIRVLEEKKDTFS
jgi:hypothetical protein